MTIDDLFEHAVAERMHSRPELFQLGIIFAIRVTDADDLAWTIDLQTPAPHCRAGLDDRAQCVLETDRESLKAIAADPACAVDLYYSGKLTVVGNIAAAQQAQAFLNLAFSATAPPEEFNLQRLITPIDIATFKSEYWPNRHVVTHDAFERFGGLAQLAQLDDIDSLLDAWRGVVRVFPLASSDEYDAPAVRPDQARELWKRGFALVFEGAEEYIPELVPMLDRIQNELGLANTAYARCIVYATPRGAGAKPHFDQNANFVVQLRGHKHWRIAENLQIRNPSGRHVMDAAHTNPELSAQATGEFPKRMPDDAMSVHLKRGSMLFLPNAYWHTTTAEEDALALNFTFSQPSWADLVSEGIRRRLVMDPRWRELAAGVGSREPEHTAAAVERLEAFIGELADEVRSIDTRGIIASLAGGGHHIRDILDLDRDWVATLSAAQNNEDSSTNNND
jgi:50S ribosomal protein L16 3-hydroxylase